ncbi:AAA family ATPase [Arthrobacter sp. B2a2-09]|uniref:AAA family ATPase n=1 Tax=Arthrobacter sp. B2a2-09 TaxID=2952822 RepID=UPI0022CD97D5|nr:AAA family ATPase [Arthrobacter sp. B2a2-09]MCZ9883710.1 AAA family ATPase [Arthrobacter sp. B2a2-09]
MDSLEEGRDLAAQGLPSYVKNERGYLKFVPELLCDEAAEQRKQAETAAKIAETQARLLAEDQARTDDFKETNRLKSVADMLKTPEIDWLVEDKIHRSGLFQIFGASYTGKTLVVLDLVMSWCAGLDNWQGYRLNNGGEPQEAVYVAAEGGAALSVHVDAWLKYHKDIDPSRLDGLVFLDGGDGDHMFLGVGKSDVEAKDSWTRLLYEVAELDLNPSLVVFDTQIDLAPGVDENSNTDMVGVLREVKRLGDTAGFMAVVVHHTGHDGNKARGASGMMGKCDAQAKLTSIGEKSGKAKLEWTKVKGRAVPQDSISYHIQGYRDIPGFDSEGAVCVPLDKTAAAYSEISSKRPTDDTVRLIMNALTNGELSVRALSEAVGIDRNTKAFKDAIEWMTYSNYLTQSKQGRSSMVGLAPFAVAPEDPAINS